MKNGEDADNNEGWYNINRQSQGDLLGTGSGNEKVLGCNPREYYKVHIISLRFSTHSLTNFKSGFKTSVSPLLYVIRKINLSSLDKVENCVNEFRQSNNVFLSVWSIGHYITK